MYNAVADEYQPAKRSRGADKVDKWVAHLSSDATFNFESYAECFVSENLVRKYIVHKKLALSKEAKSEAKNFRTKESEGKKRGNISINVRRDAGGAWDMDVIWSGVLPCPKITSGKPFRMAR